MKMTIHHTVDDAECSCDVRVKDGKEYRHAQKWDSFFLEMECLVKYSVYEIKQPGVQTTTTIVLQYAQLGDVL